MGPTMSSREIAELCEKRHGHVMRDIEKTLGDIGFEAEGYIQNWTDPQNGAVYREYQLPEDLTMTLITGYRAVISLPPMGEVIVRLADRGVIDVPPVGEDQIETSHGRIHKVQVYHLAKRDSFVVVAQLSYGAAAGTGLGQPGGGRRRGPAA